MPVGAVAAGLGAAGAIGSAVISSNASKDASDAQVKANQQAEQTQLQMYNQTRSDLAPYMQTGNAALTSLASLFGLNSGGPTSGSMKNAMSMLKNYPGYQFALQQGDKALDASAASRGLLVSSGQLKDAQQFGQGLATQTFGNLFNQEYSLAGLGQNAAAGVGSAGVQTGANIANNQVGAGNAQAAGIIGQSNATTAGLTGGLNNALLGYSIYNNANQNNTVNPYAGSFVNSGVDPQSGALVMSDVRSKKNIRRVGETKTGVPLYLYEYKSGGPTHIGVLAQELERTNPKAVVTRADGVKLVDYSKVA